MDSDPLAKPFDVAVIGTSLSASIIAAAASRSGLTVLHIESSDTYGGEDSTATLQQFVAAANPEYNVHAEQIPESQPSAAPDAPDGWSVLGVHPAGRGTSGGRIIVDCSAVPEALVGVARKVQLDCWPRLTYCRGPATALLVEAGVSSYLDYKCLESDALVSLGLPEERLSAQLVPAGKGDVFQHSELSLGDKRRLMKLLQFVMDSGLEDDVAAPATDVNEVQLGSGRSLLRPQNKGAPAYDLAAFEGKSTADFLQHVGVEGRLRTMLLHAVAMVDTPASAPVAAGANMVAQPDAVSGVQRLHAHVSSLGRFGACAYLSTMYGCGELSQAFCRACAVHGGLYMLRTRVKAWLTGQLGHKGKDGGKGEADGTTGAAAVPADTSSLVGLDLLDDAGTVTRVHVRHCVVAPGQQAILPSQWLQAQPGANIVGYVVVLVCLTSGPLCIPGLPADHGLVHAVIPPGEGPAHMPMAVHILQGGPSTAVCPNGYGVVHCMTRVMSNESAGRDAALSLRGKMLPALFNQGTAGQDGEDGRPGLHWHATYLLPLWSGPAQLSPTAPTNITCLPGQLCGETARHSFVTIDGPVEAARQAWPGIAGQGVPMFPPVKKQKRDDEELEAGEGDAGAVEVPSGGSNDDLAGSAVATGTGAPEATGAAQQADGSAVAAPPPTPAVAPSGELDVQAALALLDSGGLLDEL